MLSKLLRLFRKIAKSGERNQDQRTFNPLYTYYAAFDARKVIIDATPKLLKPTQGTVTNFLGVKVPVQVMPSILSKLAGTVEAVPEPGNWHADIAEWAGALRSVEMARDRYQIIELGCGWGCWINNMGVAAKARGLEVRLIGIEGDRKHLTDAEMTLALNEFDPSEYRLIHGIAGPTDGMAFFPKLDETNEVWGAKAIFFPDHATAYTLRNSGQYQELKCYTLLELSEGIVTDLLHIDIQGAEVAFIQSNLDSMRKTVRRVLIGTHSRVIDGQIMEILLNDGWKLEIERPAIHEIVSGRPDIRIDGVQLWLNSDLVTNN